MRDRWQTRYEIVRSPVKVFADVSHAPEATMPADTNNDQMMTPADVARLLKTTEKTLREWRRATPQRGPAFCKLGDGKSSSVRYRREAVATWLDERTNPTRTPSQEPKK
jgi:hypothetical protein